MRVTLLSSVLWLLETAVGVHHSLPEDLYSHPKYRLAFLNELPLLNETAERWIANGLRGGEEEFLGRWTDTGTPIVETSRIDSSPGSTSDTDVTAHVRQTAKYRLEHMKLGAHSSFLCFVPPKPELKWDTPAEESKASPVQMWSLLNSLTGTCLYHRQGWFTYSYCHNDLVRQFREQAHSHPHPPNGLVPQEDPEWEAFTLGKSPTGKAASNNNKLSTRDELELADRQNLKLAGDVGGHYIVQRWTDGTPCERIKGRPREIEVQFHCDPATTDHILMVKETRTCEYVLVVHTPRLCGEPGFRSRAADREEAVVRCREVVQSLPTKDYRPRLQPSEGIFPATVPRVRRPALGTIPQQRADEPDPRVSAKPAKGLDATREAIKKVLQSFLYGGEENVPTGRILDENDDGEILIELDLDDENQVDPEGDEGRAPSIDDIMKKYYAMKEDKQKKKEPNKKRKRAVEPNDEL